MAGCPDVCENEIRMYRHTLVIAARQTHPPFPVSILRGPAGPFSPYISHLFILPCYSSVLLSASPKMMKALFYELVQETMAQQRVQ